jgi:mRNA interferase MazF
MNEGDIVLTHLPQADGQLKYRPAIVLRQMPPFGDLLVCGVSSQLHQAANDFDELIEPVHDDFAGSSLHGASLIRLGFLTVRPANKFTGKIGVISSQRHRRLLDRLAQHLKAK